MAVGFKSPRVPWGPRVMYLAVGFMSHVTSSGVRILWFLPAILRLMQTWVSVARGWMLAPDQTVQSKIDMSFFLPPISFFS